MDSHIDPDLSEKIVKEVKSQGAFDAFRKDCIADVDTKPAYQNLRLRVEDSVHKFLSKLQWTPDLNKNQVRERMRDHIIQSNFLDKGVERIVDQVVNPKISTVFKPKIEEISYKYLNIPMPPASSYQPPPPPSYILPPPLPAGPPPQPPPPGGLNIDTCNLLPNDLEQISPDSDARSNRSVRDEVIDMDIDPTDEEDNDIASDEDESPPFEPLTKEQQDIGKSYEKTSTLNDAACGTAMQHLPEAMKSSNAALETVNISSKIADLVKESSRSFDAGISQESQLSVVSSDTNISTVSNKNQSIEAAATANISEEAQMPKFNENSNDLAGMQGVSELHFDIKKDEIKFEGTDRKSTILTTNIDTKIEETFDANDQNKQLEEKIVSMKIEESENDAVAIKLKDEAPVLPAIPNISDNISLPLIKRELTPTPTDDGLINNSFGSTLDDSETGQLCIEEKFQAESNTDSERKILIAANNNEASNSNSVLNSPAQVYAAIKNNKEKIDRSSSVHKTHSSSKDKHRSSRKHSYRDESRDRRNSYKSYNSTENRHHYRDKRLKSTSKDRGSSNHRNRDKDQNHSDNRSDENKHSRSTSKHRHGATKVQNKIVKDSKHSKSAISTCSSSSSRSAGVHRDSKEKLRHKDKHHSSSSSSREKKSSSRYDDHHNERKEKSRRRKSHDSSEDGKTFNNGRFHKSGKTHTSTHNSSSSNKNKSQTRKSNDNSYNGTKEETHEVVNNTDVNIDLCNNSRDELHLEDLKISSIYMPALTEILKMASTSITESKANELSIDCDPHQKLTNEHLNDLRIMPNTIIKRRLTSTSCKPSPTLSDVSANSKENEHLDKNQFNSVTTPTDKGALNSNSSKLRQQRYSSEDLYKPRPILSQRSRRHRIDSNN